MKELELNKKLHVVEYETEEMKTAIEFATSGTAHKINNQKVKFICKGSGLTEYIASWLVEHKWMPIWGTKDYKNEANHFTSSLESFISALESKGYHWGKNPFDKVDPENSIYENDLVLFDEDLTRWQEAQSRTFNPEKTLIFEIL